jgi:hypothetical protein
MKSVMFVVICSYLLFGFLNLKYVLFNDYPRARSPVNHRAYDFLESLAAFSMAIILVWIWRHCFPYETD